MFNKEEFVLYSGTDNYPLHNNIVENVNKLADCDLNFHHMDMGEFPDGEEDDKLEQFEDIKGRKVILFYTVSDRKQFVQFLTNAWACKHQYGAKKIIVVMPFMRYRRQDHKEEQYHYEINRNEMFLHFMKAAGVDVLFLCDIHNEITISTAGKLGIEAYNIDPAEAFVEFLKNIAKAKGKDKYVIRTPDYGSIRRAARLAKMLKVRVSLAKKFRLPNGDIVSIDGDNNILTEIKGAYPEIEFVVLDDYSGLSVCLREDELNTGSTSNSDARFLKSKGAVSVDLCVTHAVCSPSWKRKVFYQNPFDRVFMGNTLPRGYEKGTGGKITTVDMSFVIAQKIVENLKID